MEKVISGIRPTGNLHLGNYFGAVKSFVKMQEEYNCMFFIADWHSLTTHPTPENIRTSVRTILAEYLACGIDPQKAPIYVQSDVKQVLELYLYLNMNAYLGELERVTSFKENSTCELSKGKFPAVTVFQSKTVAVILSICFLLTVMVKW